MKQLSLIYPQTPGWKKRETSKAAARSLRSKAPTLRDRVLEILQKSPATADQCADRLGLSILSIRPRLSELVALGQIQDSGRRALNDSGKSAIVWETMNAEAHPRGTAQP